MKKEFIKRAIIFGMTTLIVTNMYYIPASAKWISDSKNNWNWIEDKEKATGWKEIDKKWYYFNEDGRMITGWLNYNKKWYNLSSSGAMNIGWIDDNGTQYFTNSNGEMETGTIGIDGIVYTFSDSGAMINNKDMTKEILFGAKDVNNLKSNKNDSKERVGYVSTNGDSLNVRLGSTISSDIIGTVAKDAEVKIIGDEENEFYPIMINEKKGWISSKWISFEKPKDSYTNINSTINSISANNSISNSKIEPTPVKIDNIELEDESLNKGVIRDTEPSLDDKHYYSDQNLFYKIKLSPPFSSGGTLIKGNCTWYAWGRAWEITGKKPDDAGFIGNAYEWWEANKKSGKYQYGSKPRVGSIAVWKSDLSGSGGSGHVAIVEKINDGKVYISESMWHGVTFKYREIYETNHLYGYIYLDKPNK